MVLKMKRNQKLEFHSITQQIELENLYECAKMKEICNVCEQLCVSTPKEGEGNVQGFCIVCNENIDFKYDWQYSDLQKINFRERLICPTCGLNNRQRAIANLINQNIDEKNSITQFLKRNIKLFGSSQQKTIYFYECVTPFYNAVSKTLLAGHKVIGSEFLGYDKVSGEIIDGIRHEDALDLSFEDKSLDMIVSNDVFEHVPDIEIALKEAYRTLKQNGKLIFSIPFAHTAKTKKRAQLLDGKLELLEEAIYHGNPVSSNGSLVFYDFGWDILEIVTRVGFLNANLVACFDRRYAHLNYLPLFMFIANK